MALVRKTSAIREEINTAIDNLEANKIKNLFKSLEITKAIHQFFETAYYNGVFFSQGHIDSLKNISSPEIQNIFTLEKSKCIFSVVGQDENYNVQNIRSIGFELSKDFTLPLIRTDKPLMALYIPNKIGIYFASNWGYNRNHFSIVMLMPQIFGEDIRPCTEVIPLSGSGFTSQSQDVLRSNARIIQKGDLPPPVQEAWDVLAQRRDQIWQVIEKFERTRAYIFRQLWQFPSINKMIEFFPNLKGLLSNDTVNRYMKGTSRKKAEYGIVAPTADIIGATVEANISGIIDDDDN